MLGTALNTVLAKKSRNPKIDLTRMNKNSDLEQELAKPPENHALTFVRDEHLFYLNRVPVHQRGSRVRDLVYRKNQRLRDINYYQ